MSSLTVTLAPTTTSEPIVIGPTQTHDAPKKQLFPIAGAPKIPFLEEKDDPRVTP